MTTLLLIAAAGAIWYYTTGRRPKTGPGASADTWARQAAGPLHHILAALGWRTRNYRIAARRRAGAAGERRTARRLAPLTGEGFTILHDRCLPRGRANVDHLAISPTGRVILPDTKRWSSRYPLTIRDGRLMHGQRDVTDRLDGLHHETETVATVLGVPVTPLVVMDGAPISAGELVLDGIRIVPADRALAVIRQLGRGRGPGPAIASRAAQLLPPYTANTRRQHHGRG